MNVNSGKISTRSLRGNEIDFTTEARAIQHAARTGVMRVVRLAQLVFFSTTGGDAWMLDPENGYAACLAREGTSLPIPMSESGTLLSVEWNADYRIEGEAFAIAERGVSATRTICGYPTTEIERLICKYPAESRVKALDTDAARVRLKTGRNEPCPCRSGRKYKKCCLTQDEDLVSQTVAAQRATITRAEFNEETPNGPVPAHGTSVQSNARDEVLEKRDQVWDAFEALEQPTRKQLDQFLEDLLALPPEATDWSDVLKALAKRGYGDLPGAFCRIADTVPHDEQTAMGYFYWAAAEIFVRRGHEDLLPKVATGFRRAGPEHYEDEALSHIEDVLLAAGFEDETLRLAEDCLPTRDASGKLSSHDTGQCDLIFDLRAGIALRRDREARPSVDAVAEDLERRLQGVADSDFVRRCAAAICATEPASSWVRAQFDMVHAGTNHSSAKQEYLRLYETLIAVTRDAWETDQIAPGRALRGLSRLLRSVYEERTERREKRKKRAAPTNLLNHLNASAIEARVAGSCRDLMSISMSRARVLLDAYEVLLNFAARHELVPAGDATAAHTEVARLRGILGLSDASRHASAASFPKGDSRLSAGDARLL
jgi:hypothetical protein